MNQKRAGIVGCGEIAKYHLKGYTENKVPVVGVADVNPEATAAMASNLPDAKVFADHRALIDSGAVDIVSICVPPAFHEEVAVYALERGVHVLCEKPFAHTPESARRIVAAAEQSAALLMCAFRHRFLPAVRKLRELLDDIGPPVLFHNTFGGPLLHLKEKWFARREISGGGALIDTASHSVDLFRFLAGEIEEQCGFQHRHQEGIEVEDAGILALRSESGCLGSLCATWVAGVGVAQLDIVGRKGRVLYDYDERDRIRLRLPGEADWKIVPVEGSSGFAEQIEHFLGAIEGRWELTCTARDGLRSIEVLDGGCKSPEM